jgi:hypothetical protein
MQLEDAMLDLAIPIYVDEDITIVQASSGVALKVIGWPEDGEAQLVAFSARGKTCEIVTADEVAIGIKSALKALDEARVFDGEKPGWYRSLQLYAS